MRPTLRGLRARQELRALHHSPTRAQRRAYRNLGGFEPSSYRLDPQANWLPRGVVIEAPYGLAFSFRDPHGLHETVVLPDGSRFELFPPFDVERLCSELSD
jgi:hypothetical protein